MLSLRNKIALVSQETITYNNSFIENIRFGKLEAEEKEIIQAAKSAGIDKFIMSTSDGYNTILGESGNKLSGGQRQRISIARAILKNPEILILDEATSAVDNETEAAIQRSLDTLKEGRTVVAIAHRLSTIRNADIIYVLEKGKIVESGTHEELVKLKKVYANLWPGS